MGFKWSPFSNKQLKLLTWWMPENNKKSYNGIIAEGSVRSGKTLILSFSFINWAMNTYSGQNFAITGKTIGSLRRNVIVGLKEILFSNSIGKYINFSFSKLKNVVIDECNFAEGILQQTKLDKVIFNEADLSNAYFNKTNLNKIDFTTCDITGIDAEIEDLAGVTVNAIQALDLTRLMKIVIK